MICDRIPKLNKCCCCINLRMGGLIIAAFVAVFSIINVIGGIQVIGDLNEDETDYNTQLTGSIITIAIACLDILLGIFLFFGIITNRYHWLLPYLWIRGVLLAVYLVISVVIFFFNVAVGFVLLIGFFLSLYFWMCVQSLYQEMKGQV